MGRAERRLEEREAKRRDGKRRNQFSDMKGKRLAIYRSGRVKAEPPSNVAERSPP